MAVPDREITAHRSAQKQAVELFVSERLSDGSISLGTDVIMAVSDPARMRGSTMDISYEAATLLLTDLWVAGFRPTGVEHATDAAQNMARHLEDMRAIAFDKLRVAKPGERK